MPEALTLEEAIQALTPKRRVLLYELPKHQWDITKAGLACGCYAESYARDRLPQLIKQDVGFCRAMELQRQEIEEQTGIGLDWWVKETQKRYLACVAKGDETNAKGHLDAVGRHVGAFAQDNAQKGQTARQITIIMPEQQRKAIDGVVIDNPSGTKELGDSSA